MPSTQPKPARPPQPDTPASADARLALALPTACLAAIAVIAPLLAGIPDEQAWTSLIAALALVCGAWLLLRRGPTAPGETFFRRGCAGLPAVWLLSLALRWAFEDHFAVTYVDPMLRSAAYWAAMGCIALAAASVARASRAAAYIVLIAVAGTAALASALGMQDYLVQVLRNHIKDWREFATSTPDYFAGYLLITIPATLALFLAAPSARGNRVNLLYGFAFLLQLLVLPTTGSRFALVSLAVGIAAFAGGLLVLRKSGFRLSGAGARRLWAMVGFVALGAAATAGPVAHRLASSAQNAHSLDFRKYTWAGAFRLFLRHPALGAGPGTFVYEYPKYASVGFTRVAHSGYLQVMDDAGIVGLACVITVLVDALVAGLNVLRAPGDGEARVGAPAAGLFLASFAPDAPGADRLIACGLVAGIAGALVQNFIDSDWSMTLCGATLFLCAGLAAGTASRLRLAEAPSVPLHSPLRFSLAALAALAAVLCAVWSAAAFSAQAGDLEQAASLAPLSGDYLKEYAWKVQAKDNDLAGALSSLSRAIALAPEPVAYYRKALLLDATHRPGEALATVREGLAYDPNSLELLLQGARIAAELGDNKTALEYDRRMSALENGPYGQVLAITEVTEYRYAFADQALGADALRRGGFAAAKSYLQRAESRLETYASEGGSANAMRAAQVGSGGAALDEQLQGLYTVVMQQLAVAQEQSGDPAAADLVRKKLAQVGPSFVHAAPAGG